MVWVNLFWMLLIINLFTKIIPISRTSSHFLLINLFELDLSFFIFELTNLLVN